MSRRRRPARRPAAPDGILDLYRRNTRRAWTVIAGFALAITALGFGLGAIFGRERIGVVLGLLITMTMIWFAYSLGDRVILGTSGARPLNAAEEPRLFNITEGLCIAADSPVPSLWLIEEAGANAFATGRDPSHGSIAVTRGLLEVANRVELEAVIAHELAHLNERDTFVTLVLATLVGAALLLGEGLVNKARQTARKADELRVARGPVGSFVEVFVAIVTIVPVVAGVIRLSLSERREHIADVGAVRYTRYPAGLVAAMRTIQRHGSVVRTAMRATAALWFVSPFPEERGIVGTLNRLYSAHPSIEDRIDLLREL